MPKKVLPMIISIAAALGVGGISALLTKQSMPIYSSLNLPALAPPSWVFPIVWTVLFVMMGMAAAMVWCSNGEKFDTPLILYAVQLGVNFFWTIIFFNLQAFFFAFIWLLLLIVLIIATAVLFYRQNKAAGWLFLPYFAWVCFAGYLNFGVWVLNS
ncbi:MAG: TspO/MBR family protein [Oscillospiraceae bacterium]